MKNNPITREV